MRNLLSLICVFCFYLLQNAHAQQTDTLKTDAAWKGDEVRKSVMAAVAENVSFNTAQSVVGHKAMAPAADTANSWLNESSSFEVTGGDLPKGQLSLEYKYILYWSCSELSKKGNVIIAGIAWDKKGKPSYFEGWIYPP